MYQATKALELSHIAAVCTRLMALGRPKAKALHDVATAYMLTAAQVRVIITLI